MGAHPPEMKPPSDRSDGERRRRLLEAEQRALSLLDAIEAQGLIAPGRSEKEVEGDIYDLASRRFGVDRHWHKRIVRAGRNTLAIAAEDPPVVTIADNDLVFLDLGPVFGEWEADVGRTYVMGADPDRRRLVRDLETEFETVRRRFLNDPNITGAELYAFACTSARSAGWLFGGKIAGHLVGEHPHALWPGETRLGHIRPENTTRMRDPDAFGRERHWILEIHLVAPDGEFGGFYERLMLPD